MILSNLSKFIFVIFTIYKAISNALHFIPSPLMISVWVMWANILHANKIWKDVPRWDTNWTFWSIWKIHIILICQSKSPFKPISLHILQSQVKFELGVISHLSAAPWAPALPAAAPSSVSWWTGDPQTPCSYGSAKTLQQQQKHKRHDDRLKWANKQAGNIIPK